MKKLLVILLSLTALQAAAQTDSLGVAADSVAWKKELKEVTVTTQRQLIKQEIDRIGYNVQADAEAKTQTVMDMLRKVPMVTVDGQDNITVKGNSNFRVYKNGHLDPSLTKNAKEILKSMPASMVKRIEVITDPGAREDAEGVNAILNIVMQENSGLGGVMGVVNAYYNTLNHPNLYASLTGQTGRLLVSADGGYGGMGRRETENHNNTERLFVHSGNQLLSRYEGTNPGHIVFANLSASYDIDTLNLLSASFGGYFYKLNVQGDGTTQLLPPAGTALGGYSYESHRWMPGYSHQSWSGRLDYQHKTRLKGEQLTLSYMLALTRQHTDDETSYGNIVGKPFDYTGHLQNTRERFTEHTLQVDWLRPLGSGHRVEVGAKYIDRNNNSHSRQQFYGVDAASDQRFDHVTRVMAAYVDYLYNRERWSARAGVRYEHSYMRGSYPDGSDATFRRRLDDWVPQASVQYQFSEGQTLKLNYTTSISRPGISYLNPAVVASPTTVYGGNPRLVSARTQSIGLIYSNIGRRLTLQLAPTYKFSSGGITSVEWATGDVRCLTYDNVLGRRCLQFEQYVQWRPTAKTTLVVNNNVRYEYFRNPNLGYLNDGWSDNYYANLTQVLPWRLNFTLGGYGSMGRRPIDAYYKQCSYYGYYATLQRSFLKEDRLTVLVGARNPFERTVRYGSLTVNGDFLDRVTSYNRGRQFNVSVTWRFGSLKAKVKKVDRSIENDDVVGGITKGA
ncbi:MAG: TonB-dependent receptor [Prevotella sp.]|nr:TonB-dependent receptor [Prevotella sp.]